MSTNRGAALRGRIAARGEVVIAAPTRDVDLDFVLETEWAPENARYLDPCAREEHEKAIEDPTATHWTLWSADGERVGYAMLFRDEESIELRRLAITKKGQGLGRDAVRLIKAWAFDVSGAQRLWLDVYDFNRPARYLYESEGFVLDGEQSESASDGGPDQASETVERPAASPATDDPPELIIMSLLQGAYRRAAS